jgi:LacI family transcriptional regulator
VAITIWQVAREAGVSVATVSRALNNKGPVGDATRRRVQEVATRLRYVPHGTARSLITRTTHTIGVLLPDIHGEFFSELIRGIDLAARRRGYHLLVSGSHSDRAEMEAMLRTTRGRVDGLIVMSPEIEGEILTANLSESTPVVLLNRAAAASRFDSICVDNYGGALAMTRHLRAAGYRRIAFVRGPAGNHDAEERLRGYRHGLGTHAEILIDGDFSEQAGYQAGRTILALEPRPDAVFAANDGMAIGVLAAVRDGGLDVPADLAVTGFDDIPIARYLSPALPTVHVPIDELGSRSLQRLLRAIESPGRRTHRRETLPATLVVRESCGSRIAGKALGTATATEHDDHYRVPARPRLGVPRARDAPISPAVQRFSGPGPPHRRDTRSQPK